MTLCNKGCGRPAKIRGYCKSHYQAKRTKWIRAGIWPGMPNATGTVRRLQALAAIGWSPSELARRAGVNRSTLEHLIKGRVKRTSLATVQAVADTYEKLSMSQGPSRMWRDTAKQRGWAPPLAWDDDTIDNPDAKPERGQDVTVSFPDKISELRDCGYSDLIIAQRLGVQPASLLRQLNRYNITPDPELVYEATSRKWARSREHAS